MNEKPIFDIGPVVDDHRRDGGANDQPVIGDQPDIGVSRHDDSSKSRSLQGVRPRTPAERDRRSGLRLAVIAILVALGALIAVPLFTRGDDSAVEPDRIADDAERVVDDNATGDDRLVNDGNTQPGFEPPHVFEHLRSDDVRLLFENEIDNTETQFGIAFVADEEFIVLDHRGISIPQLEIAVDFNTVSNLALLTNDGRTWAIDPENRDNSFLVSNSYVVVVSRRPGTIAIIRPDEQSQIRLMSSALPVPSVALPEGAELLWVQGRGPLVMPRTGGTFEVSGLASSLERISDDRAVAASTQGTVYESCEDDLSCAYFAQTDQGPLVELPFGSEREFNISPDGRWLVAISGSRMLMTVFDIETATTVYTLGPDRSAIDWSPDSSFVAFVIGDMLQIFYPETRELRVLQLNQTPDVDSLLIFSS